MRQQSSRLTCCHSVSRWISKNQGPRQGHQQVFTDQGWRLHREMRLKTKRYQWRWRVPWEGSLMWAAWLPVVGSRAWSYLPAPYCEYVKYNNEDYRCPDLPPDSHSHPSKLQHVQRKRQVAELSPFQQHLQPPPSKDRSRTDNFAEAASPHELFSQWISSFGRSCSSSDQCTCSDKWLKSWFVSESKSMCCCQRMTILKEHTIFWCISKC